jgi:hypothetical protein
MKQLLLCYASYDTRLLQYGIGSIRISLFAPELGGASVPPFLFIEDIQYD